MLLTDLHTGERGYIQALHPPHPDLQLRFQELGLVEGAEILMVRNAPLKDLLEYRLLHSRVSLSRAEAQLIEISPAKSSSSQSESPSPDDRLHWLDRLFTHRIWGYPIFLGIMFLTFQLTFSLGAYPMAWIEEGIAWLADFVKKLFEEGPLLDLLVEGLLGGMGGVLVFLPNIVLLYLSLALLEGTGYMARAALLMDRVMRMFGLEGRSFIPMIMGFGCNVPAVLATSSIKSRGPRILTMLVIPFMSCSAKLPVYLLLTGAFFPNHAGLVLFGLYLLGVVLAILSAVCLGRWLGLRGTGNVSLEMDLPQYRWPTLRGVMEDVWLHSWQYLRKIGTVILLASIVIWALGYFPVGGESFIVRMGKWVHPFFAPLGFDWEMCVSLLTGIAAKEVVVSTLGVLYAGAGATVPSITSTVALSFMVFVLVYFPCISTLIAIGKESGSYRWVLLIVIYTLLLAWGMSYGITSLGSWLGWG